MSDDNKKLTIYQVAVELELINFTELQGCGEMDLGARPLFFSLEKAKKFAEEWAEKFKDDVAITYDPAKTNLKTPYIVTWVWEKCFDDDFLRLKIQTEDHRHPDLFSIAVFSSVVDEDPTIIV